MCIPSHMSQRLTKYYEKTGQTELEEKQRKSNAAIERVCETYRTPQEKLIHFVQIAQGISNSFMPLKAKDHQNAQFGSNRISLEKSIPLWAKAMAIFSVLAIAGGAVAYTRG